MPGIEHQDTTREESCLGGIGGVGCVEGGSVGEGYGGMG